MDDWENQEFPQSNAMLLVQQKMIEKLNTLRQEYEQLQTQINAACKHIVQCDRCNLWFYSWGDGGLSVRTVHKLEDIESRGGIVSVSVPCLLCLKSYCITCWNTDTKGHVKKRHTKHPLRKWIVEELGEPIVENGEYAITDVYCHECLLRKPQVYP